MRKLEIDVWSNSSKFTKLEMTELSFGSKFGWPQAFALDPLLDTERSVCSVGQGKAYGQKTDSQEISEESRAP